MDVESKILAILLANRHIGYRKNIRHTIIAYTYNNKQLHWAINSYDACCSTSKKAGHYFDHAETRLLQHVSFIPKTIYILGITQGKKIMSNTIPCDKCMRTLQEKGVKNIVCLSNDRLIKIKIL